MLVDFAYDAAGIHIVNCDTTIDSHTFGYNALGQRAFKPRFQTAAPGDADGDGVVDENDLKSLRDMIKGKVPASPAADCNGDGAIDNQDTGCIARQIGAAKSQGKGKNSEPETATVTTTAMDGELTQVGWILFAYDEAGRLIGEYDEAGNPIRRYVWLEDLPLAVISAEGIHYLHADHLNTPKVVTDPQGAIVWQADYQPFGEVTEVVANTEMNLRFPGQYHDRETNLYQNWHREYVPELGRYSQSDPIGVFGGLATYAYGAMNPVKHTDPSGLLITKCIKCYRLGKKWEELWEKCDSKCSPPDPTGNRAQDLVNLVEYTHGTMDMNEPIRRCIDKEHPNLAAEWAFACGDCVIPMPTPRGIRRSGGG